MKVLLLCMAFAAVSLAMPVAEENAASELAAPASVVEAKADEKPQADEKKPDQISAVKETEKEPPAKNAVADVPVKAPEAVPTEKAVEIVSESKAAVSEIPEAEKKPEPSEPKAQAISKPVPADELKQDAPKMSDKASEEISENNASKDVASANSEFAKEPIDKEGPNPSGRSDLLTPLDKDEAVPESKKEIPAKPEKPEENKPEIKAEEKSAETKVDANDAPRIIRDTITEKPVEKSEAQAEPKSEALAKEEPKESDKDKEDSVKEVKPEQAPEPASKSAVEKQEPDVKSAPVDETVIPKEASVETDQSKSAAVEEPITAVQPEQDTELKPATENQPQSNSEQPKPVEVSKPQEDKLPKDQPQPEKDDKKKPKDSSESNESSSEESGEAN